MSTVSKEGHSSLALPSVNVEILGLIHGSLALWHCLISSHLFNVLASWKRKACRGSWGKGEPLFPGSPHLLSCLLLIYKVFGTAYVPGMEPGLIATKINKKDVLSPLSCSQPTRKNSIENSELCCTYTCVCCTWKMVCLHHGWSELEEQKRLLVPWERRGSGSGH